MIYNYNRLWKRLVDKGAAMTTGKRSLKERVAGIANARKMSATLAVFVLLFVAVAAGCTYSGAAKDGPEASAQVPQDAELRIIDPYSSAERSVMITETEDVQAFFHICETVRSNAGWMSDSYTLSYGAPVYTVHFLFPPTGPGPDYIPAHESFQMWSGGQFMLFDETDPVNGAPLVWYDADNTEYEELFESLYEKYGAGLPPADVPLALSMEAVVYADGEIMHFANGSEIRLHDVYITSEDISFYADAALTSAPAISAVMLDGNIISAAPAAITESESGGTCCYALWEEPISLSETAYIACFGGAFGVNGFSVSHATGKWPEPEVIGTYDAEYWEEVDRELASFAYPADIEIYVTEKFDVDENAEPWTLEDLIYSTDSWQFRYTGEQIANDPYATIIVYDDAGRTLWIMDDADALMIEEADGSITWATMPGDVDCADMIRHLLPWARGDYPTEGMQTAEPETLEWQRIADELGYYGIPDREPSYADAYALEDNTNHMPVWSLNGEEDVYGQCVCFRYGAVPPFAELVYMRCYEDAEHTTISNGEVFQRAKKYCEQDPLIPFADGLTVNGYSAYLSDALIWYDTDREMIFGLRDVMVNQESVEVSARLEELIALAESVQ